MPVSLQLPGNSELKNAKSRAPKRVPKASRTTTRQAAMKDTNRGLDGNLTLVTSKLAAHVIPRLNLNLAETEVFEIPDSILDLEINLDEVWQTVEDLAVTITSVTVLCEDQEDGKVTVQHDSAAAASTFGK